ncbi:MAG TPA: hypothetical protein VMW56_08965, partial [Candidatus Margulisiibacteriota bacterium]|nr:hypothetical protein [Candidatus Margulisiibacteriota bacterium]
GKVAKARQSTVKAESSACAGVQPAFAKTDATTVNAAAENQDALLFSDLLGSNLDLAVLTGKAAAKCQSVTAKGFEDMLNTILGQYNKCAKRHVTLGSSREDLKTSCVESLFNDNDRNSPFFIQDLTDFVTNPFLFKCPDGKDFVDNDVVIPGYCRHQENINLWGLCIEQRVKCRACLMINQMDNLSVDCDYADDQRHNQSCPPSIPYQLPGVACGNVVDGRIESGDLAIPYIGITDEYELILAQQTTLNLQLDATGLSDFAVGVLDDNYQLVLSGLPPLSATLKAGHYTVLVIHGALATPPSVYPYELSVGCTS